jgi:AP-2 complex subunit mu-1
MLTAVLILDRDGEIVLMRKFRKDFDLVAVDNYRLGVIAPNEIPSPAVLIDESSFLHYYENELFYVAVTRQNASANAIFEFLTRLPRIFCQVLDAKEINPIEIKKFIPDIFELLDEMVDCGYPQNTDPEALRLLTGRQSSSSSTPNTESMVTAMATNAVSWRPLNIFHQKNELFVDVIEKISVTFTASGKPIDQLVNGSIIVKSVLSGMPECKIGFKDKATGEDSSIQIDDIVFHQCVRLTEFATEKAVTFTPPDGEFELMRYRKVDNIGIPFTITSSVKESPGNKLEIRIAYKAAYDQKLVANSLSLTVPMPPNTADVDVTSTAGRGKYMPESNSVAWKCGSLNGKAVGEITITVKCLPATSRLGPGTKLSENITADFNIANFSASGLSLKFLKVVDKSGYTPEKWLRYAGRAGKYEIHCA